MKNLILLFVIINYSVLVVKNLILFYLLGVIILSWDIIMDIVMGEKKFIKKLYMKFYRFIL